MAAAGVARPPVYLQRRQARLARAAGGDACAAPPVLFVVAAEAMADACEAPAGGPGAPVVAGKLMQAAPPAARPAVVVSPPAKLSRAALVSDDVAAARLAAAMKPAMPIFAVRAKRQPVGLAVSVCSGVADGRRPPFGAGVSVGARPARLAAAYPGPVADKGRLAKGLKVVVAAVPALVAIGAAQLAV